MNKLLIGVATAAAFALPVVALASVNVQDIGTLVNGATSATVNAGESFDLTFTSDATNGDEIEYVRARARDDNNHVLSTTCTNVGRKTGDDVEMTAQVSTPSDTPQSEIDVLIDVYGNPGVSQHNGCTGSSLDSFIFQNIVRVGDNTTEGQSNGNGGGNSASTPPSWLAALIAALRPTPAPAPTGNAAKCAALADHMIGAQFMVANSANGILQGFLIGEHMSIPLLQNNQATYGFWGEQTNAALLAYKGQYGCN